MQLSLHVQAQGGAGCEREGPDGHGGDVHAPYQLILPLGRAHVEVIHQLSHTGQGCQIAASLRRDRQAAYVSSCYRLQYGHTMPSIALISWMNEQI